MYTEIMSDEYKTLGSKTYWLFLSQHLQVAGGFFVMAIAFSIMRSLSITPAETVPFFRAAGMVCWAIFFLSLIVAIISSKVKYRSYGYCLSEDALKIRQGIMSKVEMAIPYRQIQNVNIERSFSEQVFGLSRLIVLTAGEDDDNEKTKGDESQGVLPAIDQALALQLQNELIRKADVQKVIQQR